MSKSADMLEKPEAAALLGFSVRSLERLVRDKIMPIVRYERPRRVYFRRSDLEAYIGKSIAGLREARR